MTEINTNLHCGCFHCYEKPWPSFICIKDGKFLSCLFSSDYTKGPVVAEFNAGSCANMSMLFKNLELVLAQLCKFINSNQKTSTAHLYVLSDPYIKTRKFKLN